MFTEIIINSAFGVLIFVFAEQLAAFVAQNTRIDKVFRDANNPMTYRILGVLVILISIFNSLIFNFLLQ